MAKSRLSGATSIFRWSPVRPRVPSQALAAGRHLNRTSVGARPARSVEGIAAGAGAGGVRVVDREALLLDGVHEVDRGAGEVGSAHPVCHDLDSAELPAHVAFQLPLVEEQLVAQAGAASWLDSHAKPEIVSPLLLEQALHLGRRGVGQDDAALSGRLGLDSHVIRSWVLDNRSAETGQRSVSSRHSTAHRPTRLAVALITAPL